MSPALLHGLLTLVGLLVILQGLGLSLFPRVLGFMLGPTAVLAQNRGWTRLQGLGMMLLGTTFVVAATAAPEDRGQLLTVVVMGGAACAMFAMALIRRGR